MTYTASNGHRMIAITNHEDRNGDRVWDFWNAQHSPTCPCLTSEDW